MELTVSVSIDLLREGPATSSGLKISPLSLFFVIWVRFWRRDEVWTFASVHAGRWRFRPWSFLNSLLHALQRTMKRNNIRVNLIVVARGSTLSTSPLTRTRSCDTWIMKRARFLCWFSTTSIPVTQMPVAEDPNEEEDELEEEEDDDDESVARKRKRPRLSSSLKKATRRRRKGYLIRFNSTRPYS